jgi:hypothetical protein
MTRIMKLHIFAPPALVFGVLLAASSPAHAQFEGVIELKLTSGMGAGKMTVQVGKAGMRNEIDIQTKQFPMKSTMLVKASNRDVGYQIDDQNKTYREIDLARGREMATQGPKDEWTAKKLGTEKMLGYACTHAQLKSSRGAEVEVWTTKDLMDIESWAKAMGPRSPTDEGMMKALKTIGADGVFMKMVHKKADRPEESMTMEIVKVEKKSLPASTFEVPAGYTKSEMPQGLPPGAAEKIREQMKNMTPEQREALKKMLEQQQQKK